MCRSSLSLVFLFLGLTAFPQPGSAQKTPSPPPPVGSGESVIPACSADEHRQFDFWLGYWEVTDTTGQVVGTNAITRVASGCGLLEYWRSASGRTGTSLNWYEPGTGKWHQLWVGLGIYLRLSGGLEDGRMVLSGKRDSGGGAVIDRITWTPLEGGRVRQVWESSLDGGATWKLQFDGMYARKR
ncbi:MAG: hypothetical protein GWN99_00265 [Gemmatimonadetes bacterium]|uniref:DUF1579 domain-containing protein n=1 Tax=Candidatus Kutchimonas denitrificans TaxID=3056748 RepID=A0AAE4Z8S1_9BACT|nr:hypothetical protein [Gemmatimonadota bacterium]NIR73541.1 hypothetical protein [Candidatus Kutchimonas denitrificans]NIR99500.1 hypothetical protein [Gemmatimonadota bacterium]NIT65120.1 hypothetical protein [Gemmatimonadota bacterium]NIV23653.1 hypothetical protein [Gemmatimonadota bacterium]